MPKSARIGTIAAAIVNLSKFPDVNIMSINSNLARIHDNPPHIATCSTRRFDLHRGIKRERLTWRQW